MAAIDRRRNNGPPSYAPKFVQEEDAEMSDAPGTTMQEQQTSSQTEATSHIFLQTGMIAHANGSGYYERGSTKLIVAVHGPRPTTQSAPGVQALQLRSTLQFAPFHGETELDEKTMGSCLTTALAPSILAKKYPKSEIAIIVQVLESGSWGDVLAGAVTAASAALADAGIELLDLVAGVHITTDQSHGMVVGYMYNREEVTLVKMRGSMEREKEVSSLMQAAVKQAQDVNLAMNKILLQE